MNVIIVVIKNRIQLLFMIGNIFIIHYCYFMLLIMFQIMSNIPSIWLINLNGGPAVLSTSMRLNPKKKIRLHIETQQQIHRIKNCCGKVNKSYDFQIYYYVQNNCTRNTFYAEKHTLLTDILNNPLLSSYVRLCNPLQIPPEKSNIQFDENNDKAIEDNHIHDDEFLRCCCTSDGDKGTGEWMYMQPQTFSANEISSMTFQQNSENKI